MSALAQQRPWGAGQMGTSARVSAVYILALPTFQHTLQSPSWAQAVVPDRRPGPGHSRADQQGPRTPEPQLTRHRASDSTPRANLAVVVGGSQARDRAAKARLVNLQDGPQSTACPCRRGTLAAPLEAQCQPWAEGLVFSGSLCNCPFGDHSAYRVRVCPTKTVSPVRCPNENKRVELLP